MSLSEENRGLVLRFQPYIYKDKAEPFPVRCIGCSVFTGPGWSESFRNLKLDPDGCGAAAIIEYAIYYDYDIQHLYDLEHIWVAVGEDDRVLDCWCSFHGMRLRAAGVSAFRVEGTHPVLYAQPGKHAMLPHPELFGLHPQFRTACGADAGGGLLIPEMLEGKMETDEALDRMICAHIRKNFCFEPTGEYERELLADDLFVTLPELLERIPVLVARQIKEME